MTNQMKVETVMTLDDKVKQHAEENCIYFSSMHVPYISLVLKLKLCNWDKSPLPSPYSYFKD